MASSKRFPRGSRLACLVVLGLALAGEGRASVSSATRPSGAPPEAPASMMATSGVCKPGYVEAILNDWLVATKDSQFESDYAALAFYRLLDVVYVLRDLAQDFCV